MVDRDRERTMEPTPVRSYHLPASFFNACAEELGSHLPGPVALRRLRGRQASLACHCLYGVRWRLSAFRRSSTSSEQPARSISNSAALDGGGGAAEAPDKAASWRSSKRASGVAWWCEWKIFVPVSILTIRRVNFIEIKTTSYRTIFFGMICLDYFRWFRYDVW